MDCYVTSKYIKIPTNAFAITDDHEAYDRYNGENIQVLFVDDALNIDVKHIYELLIDNTNIVLPKDDFLDEEEILWTITSGGVGGVGNRIICKYRYDLQLKSITTSFDTLHIFCNKLNIDLCSVAINTLAHSKYCVRCDDLSLKIYFLAKRKIPLASYRFLVFAKHIKDIQLIVKYINRHATSRNNNTYDYGCCIASNSVRHYEWLRFELPEMIKAGDCRIVVRNGEKTYKKLIDEGYPADEIEYWMDVRTVLRSLRRYYLLSKKSKMQIIHQTTPRYLDKYDYLEHVARMVHNAYLECGLYESYFRFNRFKYLETWGPSAYPETRACYLKAKDAKLIRSCGVETLKPAHPEFFPNLFSELFVQSVGFDVSAIFLQNGYKGRITRVSLDDNIFYKRWLDSRSKENADVKSVMVGISNPVPGLRTEKDCQELALAVKEFADKSPLLKFYIKLHPLYAGTKQEDFYRRICDGTKNVELVASAESGIVVVSKCQIIISNLSTLVFDALCDCKPVMVCGNKTELGQVDYLENYIYSTSSFPDLYNELSQLTENEEYYAEFLRRQNQYFTNAGKNKGVDKWTCIHELILSE